MCFHVLCLQLVIEATDQTGVHNSKQQKEIAKSASVGSEVENDHTVCSMFKALLYSSCQKNKATHRFAGK